MYVCVCGCMCVCALSTDFPWKVSVMAFSPSNLSLSSVDTGNTIGTLWFTTPSSSSVAKCRHCSSSFSLMNPVRGEDLQPLGVQFGEKQLGQPTGLLPDCCQLVWRDKQLQDSTVAHRRDDALQSRVVLLEWSGALLEVYVVTHTSYGVNL